MIIVPLGVASATPTATRHLPSVALWREGTTFLFDCGENTQTRMLQAGMKRSKIDYVFISHMDGDHIFGLPGLLMTFHLQRRQRKLTLVGPKGLQEFVEANMRLGNVELSFEIDYKLLDENLENEFVVEEPDFYIEARPLDHSSFCIGYRFQEKDKPGKVDDETARSMGIAEDWQYKELKAGNDVTLDDGTVVKSADIVGEPRSGESFVYVSDTKFCESAIRLAENATILMHEATFGQKLKDKAEETKHSTAQDAAIVAKTAGAKRLVITHFSARYTNEFVLLKEARSIFADTWLANECRPIMTDPAHEKGIIKKRVDVIDVNKKPQTSKPGGKPGSKKPRGKPKKRFKKQRNPRYYKSRSEGGRGGPRRDERDTRKRPDKRKEEGGRSDDSLPITPRTPFDDFDRF